MTSEQVVRKLFEQHRSALIAGRPRSPMLTRELLKKIRSIEIVTERLVRDRLAGQYHSVFKGSGMAFSEVRAVQAGRRHPADRLERVGAHERAVREAVRRGARTTVMLLVDMSASGRFGSREQEKRELAAELGALLAFSAIRNNDRVGLIIFTDEVERFVPPEEGQEARAAGDQRDPLVPPALARDLDRRRAGVPGAGRAPAGGGLPDLRLPGAGGRLRTRAAGGRPPPRPGAGDGDRSAGGGAAAGGAGGAGGSRDRARSRCSIPRGRKRRRSPRTAGGRVRRARACGGG